MATSIPRVVTLDKKIQGISKIIDKATQVKRIFEANISLQVCMF